MLVWGKDTHALPPFSGEEAVTVGAATIMPQHLWIIAIALGVVFVNRLFFIIPFTVKPCEPVR